MAHLLKQIITKNKQTNKIIGAAATATPKQRSWGVYDYIHIYI